MAAPPKTSPNWSKKSLTGRAGRREMREMARIRGILGNYFTCIYENLDWRVILSLYVGFFVSFLPSLRRKNISQSWNVPIFPSVGRHPTGGWVLGWTFLSQSNLAGLDLYLWGWGEARQGGGGGALSDSHHYNYYFLWSHLDYKEEYQRTFVHV